MSRRTITILLLINLTGLFLSVLSLERYATIHAEGLKEPSLCAVSESFNCDLVYASSYSTLWGLPTSAWGLAYFLSFFLLLLFIRMSDEPRDNLSYFLWGYSLVGLVFSAIMAYVSHFILQTYCLYCIGTYLVNILNTLFLTFLLPKPAFSSLLGYLQRIFHKGGMKQSGFFKYSGAILVIVILTLLTVRGLNAGGKHLSKKDVDLMLAYHFEGPLVEFTFPKDTRHPWGNPGAKVEIVEFSDFQCPFCAAAAFQIKPFIAEFKKDVAFYYLHYPLDSKCNPNMEREMHPEACLMSKAAICGGEQGEFWKFHDAIFRKPTKYRHHLRLLELVKELGLDRDKFETCLKDPATDAIIAQDIKAAEAAKIQGTPSLFINGRRVKQWRSPELLRALIRKELKQ